MIDKERIECPQFDSTYRWKSGLESHTQSQHSGQLKFLECRWSFKSQGKFKEHIEYMHREHNETTTESVYSDAESDHEENKSNTEDNNSDMEENVSKSDTKNFEKYTF